MGGEISSRDDVSSSRDRAGDAGHFAAGLRASAKARNRVSVACVPFLTLRIADLGGDAPISSRDPISSSRDRGYLLAKIPKDRALRNFSQARCLRGDRRTAAGATIEHGRRRERRETTDRRPASGVGGSGCVAGEARCVRDASMVPNAR